jgi:hypothetical protein
MESIVRYLTLQLDTVRFIENFFGSKTNNAPQTKPSQKRISSLLWLDHILAFPQISTPFSTAQQRLD